MRQCIIIVFLLLGSFALQAQDDRDRSRDDAPSYDSILYELSQKKERVEAWEYVSHLGIKDSATESQLQYLIALNEHFPIPELKLKAQFAFVQKFKLFWEKSEFKRLQAMDTREVLTTQQADPYYRVALAFGIGAVELYPIIGTNPGYVIRDSDHPIRLNPIDLEIVKKIIEFRKQFKNSSIFLEDEFEVPEYNDFHGITSWKTHLGSFAVSPDGRFFLIGHVVGYLLVYDLLKKQFLDMKTPCTEKITHLTFNPDGSGYFSFGCTNRAQYFIGSIQENPFFMTWHVLELHTMNYPKLIEANMAGTNGEYITGVSFSPDHTIYAVSRSRNSNITLYRWGGIPLREVYDARNVGESIIEFNHSPKFSPDGKVLAFYAHYENKFYLSHIPAWEDLLNTPSLNPTLEDINLPHDTQLSNSTFQFSPDGHMIAIGTKDISDGKPGSESLGKIYLWDIDQHRIITTLEEANWDSSIEEIAFSPNGKILAAARLDGMIHLWNIQTEDLEIQHLEKFNASQSPELMYFKDNTHLVTIDRLGVVKTWSIQSGPNLSLIGLIDPDKVNPATGGKK